ncbi:MAG: zinc-ribbon domain-containing protein [Clostridia bacterium]|nr:zinc-ribbon domain-containing protein [Clostridia bacterium]
MGRRVKLTQGQKEEIVALYRQGMAVKEIAEAYGIDQSYVSHLGHKEGIRRRREYTKNPTGAPDKKCPHCKAKNPAKARYCMYCGKDIRDKRQILCEKVEALRAMTALLPESVSGEADEITRDVLAYLKEV